MTQTAHFTPTSTIISRRWTQYSKHFTRTQLLKDLIMELYNLRGPFQLVVQYILWCQSWSFTHKKTQPSSLVAYMSTDISSDGSTVYKEGLSFLSVSEDCFMIQHEVIHVIYRKLLYSQQHRSILHKAQTIIGHQITLTFWGLSLTHCTP